MTAYFPRQVPVLMQVLDHELPHLRGESATHPIEPPWGALAALLLLAGRSQPRRRVLPAHLVGDKDPVARWTFGRITLLGDAAHPMYPRGSNGSAHALIDGRVLSEQLAALCAAGGTDLRPALHAYEALRRPVTERVVLTNRSMPPDFINIRVDELSGGRPFRHIDDLISQDELRRLSDQYKQVAGFSLEALRAGEPPVPPPAHV